MINTDLTGNFKFLNGRPLYASISGGKDSTALGLYLLENNIKFTPVFLETGWEHPSTYEYIKNTLEPLFGSFEILRNEKYFKDDSDWKGGFEQLLEVNKIFPNKYMKFCTRELKVKPVMDFFVNVFLKTNKKPISCIGVRAEESFKRSQYEVLHEQDEASIWKPLLHHTEGDVIDLHHKYNVPPNPLYLKGYSRVGCYPCIYLRKHEIRHMSYTDPDRFQYIGELERKVNELHEYHWTTTFFGSKTKKKEFMTIDEVVQWSLNHQGKTLDDVEEIEEDGCMKWGLCEKPPKQDKHKQINLFEEK